jgi:hypothetical protein
MKLHYILFLVSIIILIITVYLWSNSIYNKTTTTTTRTTTNKEGFESLTNCLSQGYPSDFCRRVPLQACLYNCPKGTFEPKKFNTFSSQFPV